VLNIVNADTDQLSLHTVVIGGTPTFMLQTSDQKSEVVYDSTNNILSLVDNSTETVETTTSSSGLAVGGKAVLAGKIQSAALTPGAAMAYAAVPTASVATNVTGAVYGASFLTTGFLSVGIQGARYLAMDHGAVNMLVFSQNSDTVTLLTSYTQASATGTLTSSTGTLNPQPLPSSSSSAPNCSAAAFSRPVAAVFSSDDMTAYVLSSGPANGGTQAMVTVLDMSPSLNTADQAVPSPPTIKQCINVSSANVGLLQGTLLYVAGAATSTPCSTDPTQMCQQGALTVIDTSALIASNPVPFGQSAPNLLPGVLTFDGTNLWIGSTGCQIPTTAQVLANPATGYGCLALYSPGSPVSSQNPRPNTLVPTDAPGGLTDTNDDVTGMVWLQPFNGRDIMYVIEGGALQVYDNSFNNLTSTVLNQTGLDIVGQAVAADAVKN
jgi:hypothetical protein